jgi:hypothetical protein
VSGGNRGNGGLLGRNIAHGAPASARLAPVGARTGQAMVSGL